MSTIYTEAQLAHYYLDRGKVHPLLFFLCTSGLLLGYRTLGTYSFVYAYLSISLCPSPMVPFKDGFRLGHTTYINIPEIYLVLGPYSRYKIIMVHGTSEYRDWEIQ